MAAHGITPAWAGKSSLPCSRGCSSKDHPRVGGEKVSEKPTRANCARITPAWAGKRPPFRFDTGRAVDHPRVGGEKSSLSSASLHGPGSPPRGRGKEKFSATRKPGPRITPAWAGKRGLNPALAAYNGDHPRVGGEKDVANTSYDGGAGSPPRGRGKVATWITGKMPLGITPAWAGKRSRCSSCSNQRQDHPRVGGEKTNSCGTWTT